jgi:tRNA pseudouridine32 synthase / 23S rRNA pseudouridine746 synthase
VNYLPGGVSDGLRVLHADDELVVVDKPSGMPSVPARTPHDPPDVATVLAATYGPLEAVHRLDRDTSGILVLARSHAARTALGRAFESATVVKRYRAVVVGSPPNGAGTIHMPLADDPARPPRKRVDPILGRRATTCWRVIDRVEAVTGAHPALALLDLEPLTGRSHQLRVHLAWLGCPIAGDRLYGAGRDDWPLSLRAVAITFPHPRTGVPITITAPPATTDPWTWFAAPPSPSAVSP